MLNRISKYLIVGVLAVCALLLDNAPAYSLDGATVLSVVTFSGTISAEQIQSFFKDGGAAIWNIAAAIRGPDNFHGEPGRWKAAFTSRIRATVTGNSAYGVPYRDRSQVQRDLEGVKRCMEDPNIAKIPGASHYLRHIFDALNTINVVYFSEQLTQAKPPRMGGCTCSTCRAFRARPDPQPQNNNQILKMES